MCEVPRPSRVDKRRVLVLKNNLETNPDEKTCLSSEIETLQVEKVVQIGVLDHPISTGFSMLPPRDRRVGGREPAQ